MERKAAMWLVNFESWLEFVKILIFIYSGYIQTHYQKNKKIKRADKILPEVYGTTLSYIEEMMSMFTLLSCIVIVLTHRKK
jgi:glycerol uptake facilitator-like aquaporin